MSFLTVLGATFDFQSNKHAFEARRFEIDPGRDINAEIVDLDLIVSRLGYFGVFRRVLDEEFQPLPTGGFEVVVRLTEHDRERLVLAVDLDL